VSSYSRAQAIEDGVLVDVSEVSKQVFTYPVAITAAVYAQLVEWPKARNAERQCYQDESARLWDVIWMAYCAVNCSARDTDRIWFEVLAIDPSPGEPTTPHTHRLISHVGPGDDAEPVITIMLPEES